MKRILTVFAGMVLGLVIIIAALLLTSCGPTKQRLVYDVIHNPDGSTQFRRDKTDFHDNFPFDVWVCGYDEVPVRRER